MIYWLSGVFRRHAGGLRTTGVRRRGRRRAAVLRLADPRTSSATRSWRAATGSRSPASSCGSSAAGEAQRATRRSPGEEFRIAAAGPLVTLLVVVACCVALAALGVGDLDWTPRRCAIGDDVTPVAGCCSLAGRRSTRSLFVFNLVPAFPLDGGRIARAIAWKLTGDRNRATRFSAAARPGLRRTCSSASGSALRDRSGDAVGGLWFVVLGWFLARRRAGAVGRAAFRSASTASRSPTSWTPQPVAVPADADGRRGPGRVLPALPLAVVPGRRRGGPLPRASCARSAPRRRRARRRPTRPVGELVEPGAERLARSPPRTPLEALLGSEPLRRWAR